jgi:hypothetical protein
MAGSLASADNTAFQKAKHLPDTALPTTRVPAVKPRAVRTDAVCRVPSMGANAFWNSFGSASANDTDLSDLAGGDLERGQLLQGAVGFL